MGGEKLVLDAPVGLESGRSGEWHLFEEVFPFCEGKRIRDACKHGED